MARPKSLISRLPMVTLFIVCTTLITSWWPNLSELLAYDRQAIFKGEIWRIMTAPFVHFSIGHLGWNVLVFGAAGWVIESKKIWGFWILCLFSSLSSGLIFLWAMPELMFYGGLSGLATGAVVYLCLYEVKTTGKERLIWLTILVLIGVKIIIEVTTSNSLFVHIDTNFQLLPAAHILGYAGAVIVWLWGRFSRGDNWAESAGAGR